MSGNLFVHQRLGQRRCVLLVVTQLAEAHHIQHHIFAEGHAVFQRQLGGQHHRLGVVAIDVQHRGLDHLDDVGAKHAGTHVAGVRSGETNLVVDDDVHGAARGITTGLGQRQGFLVHALPAKSRVAMHQHRQHLLAQRVVAAVHARAYRALNHGVHNFKVRGVERQRQVDRTPCSVHV